MSNIGFFDLETKRLFQDVDKNYINYPWSKKQLLAPKLGRELGMACACIIDGENNKFMFDEGEETALIDKLHSFNTVIGYNVLGFDYIVLAPFDKTNSMPHIMGKTMDLFNIIKGKTEQYASLNDLAKLNIGLTKTEDSLLIPKMWAAGEKQKVREYCYNDVDLLKKIYEHGKIKSVKYYKKDFGVISGIEELQDPW